MLLGGCLVQFLVTHRVTGVKLSAVETKPMKMTRSLNFENDRRVIYNSSIRLIVAIALCVFFVNDDWKVN